MFNGHKKEPLKDDETFSYKCRIFQSQSKKLLNSNNGYQEESITLSLCLYPFQISVIISQKKLLSCYAAMGKMENSIGKAHSVESKHSFFY